MSKLFTIAAILLLGMMRAPAAAAQTPQDRDAIRRAVLDYVEGFYEGDTAKIIRAFRPDVYKYGFDYVEKENKYEGELMKYDEIIAYARRFRERGRKTPPTAAKVVDLLDVQDQIASVKLTAWWGIDYVLLAKYDGRWMISSIMWQGNPPKPAPQSAAPKRGTLFIVGGGPQTPALVKEFVDLAGGAGHSQIVVFGMASATGLATGEEKANDLRKLGATALNVFVNTAQANTDSVAHLLDGATGVWFLGGDQVTLLKALKGTKTEQAIHRMYANGAVIGGTSAGAAVMSSTMLTGDERHPGGVRPVIDTSSAGAWMTIARDNIVTTPGFGFISNAIVDQHFLRRKRNNRLISLVLEQPVHLGVGIDESTVLVVEPDGRWRVDGESVAVVYDARQASVTQPGATLGASGVVVHVLPAGSRYDPQTGIATLPLFR